VTAKRLRGYRPPTTPSHDQYRAAPFGRWLLRLAVVAAVIILIICLTTH
jgi:hypothetical protein